MFREINDYKCVAEKFTSDLERNPNPKWDFVNQNINSVRKLYPWIYTDPKYWEAFNVLCNEAREDKKKTPYSVLFYYTVNYIEKGEEKRKLIDEKYPNYQVMI